MSDVKMSEVFNLPMLCEDGDGYIYSADCRHSIRFDDTDVNCMEQKTVVSTAINSYDSNQELIAKQAAQIEQLREALANIMCYESVIYVYCGSAYAEAALKALEATKE